MVVEGAIRDRLPRFLGVGRVRIYGGRQVVERGPGGVAFRIGFWLAHYTVENEGRDHADADQNGSCSEELIFPTFTSPPATGCDVEQQSCSCVICILRWQALFADT